jgi:predicted nucleic acid-binding protein
LAAAGGHNLLLIRPPGEGKSLLASAMPGILPRLNDAEKVQLTRIYSASGALELVYVETSVISHAAARLSRVSRVAVLQHEARQWWKECRPNYRVVTSQFVVDEASLGDPDAVARRLKMLADVEIMPISELLHGVAEQLIRSASIPQAARIDALHVASAAIGGGNYLVTQNFAHIANAVTIRTIYGVLDRLGLGPLLICTPAEFLGGLDDGQE